jgi:hypothetical protein
MGYAEALIEQNRMLGNPRMVMTIFPCSLGPGPPASSVPPLSLVSSLACFALLARLVQQRNGEPRGRGRRRGRVRRGFLPWLG